MVLFGILLSFAVHHLPPKMDMKMFTVFFFSVVVVWIPHRSPFIHLKYSIYCGCQELIWTLDQHAVNEDIECSMFSTQNDTSKYTEKNPLHAHKNFNKILFMNLNQYYQRNGIFLIIWAVICSWALFYTSEMSHLHYVNFRLISNEQFFFYFI